MLETRWHRNLRPSLNHLSPGRVSKRSPTINHTIFSFECFYPARGKNARVKVAVYLVWKGENTTLSLSGWDLWDTETQIGLESDRPTKSKLLEDEAYLSLRTAIQPPNLSPYHAINRDFSRCTQRRWLWEERKFPKMSSHG